MYSARFSRRAVTRPGSGLIERVGALELLLEEADQRVDLLFGSLDVGRRHLARLRACVSTRPTRSRSVASDLDRRDTVVTSKPPLASSALWHSLQVSSNSDLRDRLELGFGRRRHVGAPVRRGPDGSLAVVVAGRRAGAGGAGVRSGRGPFGGGPAVLRGTRRPGGLDVHGQRRALTRCRRRRCNVSRACAPPLKSVRHAGVDRGRRRVRAAPPRPRPGRGAGCAGHQRRIQAL